MKFLNPQWLWLLVALPPALWLGVMDERRRQKQFEKFADRRVWRALVPEMDPGARLRKFVVWLAVVAFVLITLARPQWGTHEEVVKATGLDIMIVLDVSNSMETEDVIPSRLKKARHLVKSLSDRLLGDRMGLVAFAASSYVACPLTTDLDYLNEMLKILGPRMVTNQGTDIGLGLDTARKSLDRGAEETASGPSGDAAAVTAPQPSHVVILISDGEDQEDGALGAAKLLRENGTKLYVLGVGTEKGGPMPIRDENGNLVGYKKDRKGQPVVSQFHPDALMKVAQAAGGRYFNATAEEIEVEEILQDMGALNRTEFAERRYLIYEERFQFPLAIAVFLLLLEISAPVRRTRKTRESLKSAAGALFFLAFLLGRPVQAASLLGNQPPLEAYLENEKGLKAYKAGKVEEAQKKFGTAQALDPNLPELQYNEGVVQLQQGDVESAVHGFSEAGKQALKSGDQSLAAKSFYNLGEALVKKGDTRGAAQAYLSAIESSQQGKDVKLEESARKNLELLIHKRQQQKKQDQEKKDQKDQQDKKDGKQGENSDPGKDKKDQQDKNGKGGKDDKDKDKEKKDQQDKPVEDPSVSRKQFKSPKLTKEDAERVMAELSSKEGQLQGKLKKQSGTPQQQGNAKDW